MMDVVLHVAFIYNSTWLRDPSHSLSFAVVSRYQQVLDFSVIHLSAYERLQRRWKSRLIKNRKKSFREDESVSYVLANTTKYLKSSVEVRAETVAESFNEVCPSLCFYLSICSLL